MKLAVVLTVWAIFAITAFLRCFGIANVVQVMRSFCRGMLDEVRARLWLGPPSQLWADGWYDIGVALVRALIIVAVFAGLAIHFVGHFAEGQMSQTAELTRVSNNIRGLIQAFCKERLANGQPQFRMKDLHDYCQKNARVAPGSPDRVLRQLRKAGEINYRVVSRSASQYELCGLVSP